LQRRADGISWEAGNAVARGEHGYLDDGAIEITGYLTREGEVVEPDARIRIIPIQHGPTDRGAGARETAEAAGDPSGSGHPDLP
jgi:hypothetical protein